MYREPDQFKATILQAFCVSRDFIDSCRAYLQRKFYNPNVWTRSLHISLFKSYTTLEELRRVRLQMTGEPNLDFDTTARCAMRSTQSPVAKQADRSTPRVKCLRLHMMYPSLTKILQGLHKVFHFHWRLPRLHVTRPCQRSRGPCASAYCWRHTSAAVQLKLSSFAVELRP